MASPRVTRDYTPDNVIESDDPNIPDSEHRKALARFAVMSTFWSPIHAEGLIDDAFVAGDQWPDEVRQEREEQGRPVLTYNLLPAFLRQIINKVRQERPQIRVKPVESDRNQTPDVSNVQGTKDYSLADIYMGLIRNIEHTSRAHQAYDHALAGAVHRGFGYFALNTQYSRHDPFVQELVIERIKEAYGVFLDPSAIQADYSDAQDAFLFTRMSRAAFEAKYPDKRFESYGPGVGLNERTWHDENSIQVATYYWIEWRDDEAIKMSTGQVHYLSLVEDVLDDVKLKQGVFIQRDDQNREMRRKITRPVVMWRRMSGAEWLTEPVETVFEHIPIFPVLGDAITYRGHTLYTSATRDSRDAQRSYNYWRTAAAETVALAPKAPFMVTPDQIAGYEKMWDSANRANLPYLLYNDTERGSAPQRMQASNPAAAELANASQDAQDMQSIIGLHDASLGRTSDEKSGKAILARQAQGSTSTYTFPANLNRALEAMGRVMVEAIPRIYDSSRVMRVRMADDSEDFVEINRLELDEKSGKEFLVHDLGYGKYDVVVETGPSYATQRQEAAEAMIELLNVLPPESVAAVAHLMVKNMGFPGSDDVAAILRKQLPDNLKSEDERAADLPKGVTFDDDGKPVNEDGTPYQPEPTPELVAQQKANEIAEKQVAAEMAKADADQATAQAKTAKAQADLEQAKLEMAKLGQPDPAQAPAQPAIDPKKMVADIEKAIRAALQEHEVNPSAHKAAFEEAITEAMASVVKRLRRERESMEQRDTSSGYRF